MPRSSKAPTFESAFHELDSTVEKLERGELSLEESIALYERGIQLAGQLEKQLEEAELRVRTLQPDTLAADGESDDPLDGDDDES